MIHPRPLFLPQTLHRNNREILWPLPFKTSQYLTSSHHLFTTSGPSHQLPLLDTASGRLTGLAFAGVFPSMGSQHRTRYIGSCGSCSHHPMRASVFAVRENSLRCPPPPTTSLISPASLPLGLLCSSCPGHLILPWTFLPEEFAVFPQPIARVTSLTYSLPSSL